MGARSPSGSGSSWTCWLLVFVIGFSFGCAGNTAPSSWLPSVTEATSDGFGSWVTVYRGKGREAVHGELISVSSTGLIILSEGRLVGISSEQISKAKVTTYKSAHGTIAVWTLVGVLGTVSHGLGLIISAPAWIITGTATASAVSREPQHTVSWDEWSGLAKFARFPQGIPDEVQTLRGK